MLTAAPGLFIDAIHRGPRFGRVGPGPLLSSHAALQAAPGRSERFRVDLGRYTSISEMPRAYTDDAPIGLRGAVCGYRRPVQNSVPELIEFDSRGPAMLTVWTRIMVTVISGRVNWPRVVVVIRVAMASNAII